MDSQQLQLLGTFLSSFLALAIPLILVAYAGMFSEHSGIINLALEGIMVIGAFGGIEMLSIFNKIGFTSQWAVLIAILIAGLAGVIYSFLLSFASNKLKADQTIAGTALNIIAPALFVILAWAIQGQGYTEISVPSWTKITYTTYGISLADYQNINIFLRNLLFKQLSYMTTYVAIVLIVVSLFLLYKTKFGMRLRACGEHPQAAESLGINVIRTRYIGVAISGFLAGIGGMSYALIVGTLFKGDVAGYGFLALAVMIFGNWHGVKIIFAALFFSLFNTMANMYSSFSWMPSFTGINYSSLIYKMVPYLLTLIVLIFSSKRSQAPKAEGVPFDVATRS